MKLVVVLACFLHLTATAQEHNFPEEFSAEQLEDLTEAGDESSDSDYDIQQLKFYEKHPVSVNGPVEELREFPLFQPLMVENLIRYREVLGNFVSIYELQAVPGFTPQFLRKIERYLILGNIGRQMSLRSKLAQGESIVTIRPTLNLQSDKNFDSDQPDQRFTGGRMGIFLRYRFYYKRAVQYGFTAEKDPGEKIFQPGAKLPFDFQSAHLFLRPSGKIKSFAAGDFSVSLGQGLIFWQSQAFKKTSQVLHIKRQGDILKPYHSAGEYLFLRGVAVALSIGRFENTFFLSQRLLSANTNQDPSMGTVVSSFLTSGLHRNLLELNDRHLLRHRIAGGNFRYQFPRAQVGINVIYHDFSLPIRKRNEAYNLYAFQGTRWYNMSGDFSGTWRNFHYFGELASDPSKSLAFSGGAIASLHKKIDWAIHIRIIEASFQAINGNAFTENSSPQNESGLYSAFTIHLSSRWKLDMYADLFAFRWIKYRTDAPSTGFQYFFQATWKPGKHTEMYSRVRIRSKPLNSSAEPRVVYPLNIPSVNWRTHLNHSLSRSFTIRKRLELTCSHTPGAKIDYGSLFYFDVLYKPGSRSYSFNTRLLVYDTDNYDTRIYTYENDVPFTSQIPAFSGSGARWYGNIRWKVNLKKLKNSELSIAAKLGAQIYERRSDENVQDKTDFKVQILVTPG